MSLDVGGGLAVKQVHGTNWQALVTPSGATVAAVTIDEQNSRCKLGMTLLDGWRIVDVSREPNGWLARLRTAAFDGGEPPDRWAQAVATGLDRCGVSHAWWAERVGRAPAAVATAAAWPLLRPSVIGGFGPACVPRWSARWCASPTVQHAVRTELAGHGTREVTRLAGAHMAGPVAWWPLALMLALQQFDQGWTARILDQVDGNYCCDDFEFALLAATLVRSRPEQVLRLVSSVQDAGGPRRLLDGLENLNRIGLIRRLPTDIETLERVVAVSLPEQPLPRPVARTRRAATRNPVVRRRRAVQNQPIANQPEPPQEVLFNHPQHWRRLHMARSGEIDVLLPEGPAQLRRWGDALQNCLARYETAISRRRILVLAIRHREIIRGAVSIDPATQTIASIEAAANRRLPSEVVETVTRILVNDGAIQPA